MHPTTFCIILHWSALIQYNDLMKKKKIVENDKAKIEALIIELDEKKNAAIQGAFQQVNKVNTCIDWFYASYIMHHMVTHTTHITHMRVHTLHTHYTHL